MKRYRVETCFRPNVWTLILETDDYERAASLANFWDERQDTRVIDWLSMTALDRALLRFDVAIARIKES
jgi:hypothetical protein